MNQSALVDLVSRHQDEIRRLKTPCYVFFRKELESNLREISGTLQGAFDLIYSVKANPNLEILRSVQPFVSGFDVSSIGEAKALRSIAIATNQVVSFIGPAKTLSDNIQFLELFSQGLIVFESIEELREVQNWATAHKKKVTGLLRVDLDEKIDPNGRAFRQALQFGLTESEALEAACSVSAASFLKICGFHFHSFSQHRDHRSLIAHYSSVVRFLQKAKGRGLKLDVINFGSGMGLPYFDTSSSFDLSAFRSSIQPLVAEVRNLLAPQARFFMESGRALVGGAGIFVARVVRRKSRGEETYLILDGGFAQNAMITGVHMPMRKNFRCHVLPGSDSKEAPSERNVAISAFGPSCSVNDIVLQDVVLPETQPGDLIWFENMGAYGKTFSPQRFLSFDEPEEHFL